VTTPDRAYPTAAAQQSTTSSSGGPDGPTRDATPGGDRSANPEAIRPSSPASAPIPASVPATPQVPAGLGQSPPAAPASGGVAAPPGRAPAQRVPAPSQRVPAPQHQPAPPAQVAAGPAPGRAPGQRPAPPARGPVPRPGGPRMVRLTLGRLDPWSVMKLGFLLSVAIGISFVVLVAVLWIILQAMGVFTDIDRTIGTVLGTASGSEFDLMDYVGFGRVLSLATVIAVIDVFLLTAIATLGAFLYNISASLVGGVQMTLTDD
jgi:hypothetical protein